MSGVKFKFRGIICLCYFLPMTLSPKDKPVSTLGHPQSPLPLTFSRNPDPVPGRVRSELGITDRVSDRVSFLMSYK